MRSAKSAEEATLIDILIDGFEKNEILDGFHHRMLPLSSSEQARSKFEALSVEASAWKGPPVSSIDEADRMAATWVDLELRQAGRGILVRVRAPWFDWWHERETWAGDPMGRVYEWLLDDREGSLKVD